MISMGGTLTRLVQRENEVHVAYMTNGSIAVADDHTLQLLDFWSDLNHTFKLDTEHTAAFYDKVRKFLADKDAGEVDSFEVQEIKKRIREAEALAACRSMGISMQNAHFLDLPFYQTGEVQKRPISEQDVEIVTEPDARRSARTGYSWPANCPIRTERTVCAPRPSSRP